MKLKKKPSQRVNISKTKGLALSPSAQSAMLERVKFKIQMKLLLGLLTRYNLQIITLQQITDLVDTLQSIVDKHNNKKNGGQNSNANIQRQN